MDKENHPLGPKLSVNSRNEGRLLSELLTELEAPRRQQEVDQAIKEFGTRCNLSASGLKRLGSKVPGSLHRVPLKWNPSATAPRVQLFSSLPSHEVNPLEVAVGIHPKSYLCYQSALFWNELTEQVPQTFYVALERPGTSRSTPPPDSFDDFTLRDVFVKSAPDHHNVATLSGYRYVLLARAFTNRAGVERREVSSNGKNVSVGITGLERTLLDCASVPEDAGGVSNVVDAFEAGIERLDFKRFSRLYTALGFKYPHWQRIGFLLERLGHDRYAAQWKKQFGNPKNKFFLAKGYKLEWEFDQSWAIYYPAGLFK